MVIPVLFFLSEKSDQIKLNLSIKEEGMQEQQILIAAKKADRRAIIKYILTQYRYRIVVAKTGKTALSIYNRTKTDLVIMDATLLNLNAPALIAAIMQIKPDVKIIVMSHDPKDRRKFKYFWLKTDTIEKLIALVIKLMPIQN